ncbi:phage major capsid protein [Luteibacter rhizovicinus]|nr:phage major capsid protein [Luteibacter rhizovicinus]
MNMKHKITRGLLAVRADATGGGEVKALVNELNQAFAAFKAEHTKQLDDIRQGQADALQALKVDKINADIDRLQAAVDTANTQLAAAQMGAGGDGRKLRDADYSAAFQAHFRKGAVEASMSKGSAPDGGYTAPVEWDRTITDKLVLVSPMRQVARVQSISGNSFTKLFNKRGTASGWVGETDARPATAGSQFGSLQYDTGEIYANPAATQQLLDDSEVDIEAWIAGEVELEFAHQEGLAFISGDGTNGRPTGFLTYVTGAANAAKHPLGAIGLVNTGAAAAITADSLIDLVYAVPSAYRGAARFLMNNTTQGIVRKLKDGQGNYLWQPSTVAGQPATLNGYALTEMPDMPDVAANSMPISFGDFNRGYLVIDRKGVTVLRDPFTNKPFVQFYTTKRVGGGLLDPTPIKVLKVSV